MRILLGLLAFSLRCGAACPDGQTPVDEQVLRHARQDYRVELCQRDGSLRLALYRLEGRQEQLQAERTEKIDVEGELRELKLDRADYKLHERFPTVALLVKSRDHGVQHDQYLSDLQLYVAQGPALQRVAAIQVSRESWGTNCEGDCQDAVHGKTLVVLGPRDRSGYRQLILRTRSRVTAAGASQPALTSFETRLNWTGQGYE